ncbi:MAG: hypothetical protein HUU20_21855 [Pirellulales bacterium]|nr:hypothetical protein [Pirellulales bacterium]
MRIYGDVNVGDPDAGGVAVAVAVETQTQPLVVDVTDDPRSETYVEIRARLPDGDERVVTG